MKHMRRVLISAALLGVPATGTAQFTGHVSIGIGLAAQTHPDFRPGFGIGLAHQPVRQGTYLGIGFSAGLGSSGYPGHHGYGHHGGWDPYDCWGFVWYEPWFDCGPYYPVPWWGWHRPAWGFFGFFGWPSYRIVRHHWYGFPPRWHGGWSWYPDHYGWGWGWDRHRYRNRVRYVYDEYDDGGYATPRGYRPGGRATPRGGDRVVRGSPLFGPRYKEDPRKARVTDNATRRTPDDARRARPPVPAPEPACPRREEHPPAPRSQGPRARRLRR